MQEESGTSVCPSGKGGGKAKRGKAKENGREGREEEKREERKMGKRRERKGRERGRRKGSKYSINVALTSVHPYDLLSIQLHSFPAKSLVTLVHTISLLSYEPPVLSKSPSQEPQPVPAFQYFLRLKYNELTKTKNTTKLNQ